jgi:hypothetical protein
MSQSSTVLASASNPTQGAELVLEHWGVIEQVLPAGFAAQAKAHQALCRPRGVRSPVVLLRLVLLYAVGFSLRLVGAWGVLQGLCDISAPALLKRLQHCDAWLGWLLVELLQAQHLAFPQREGVRLCLVDATTVQEPGSRGTDWRLHLRLDLGRGLVDGVTVTSAQVGESLAHGAGQPGVIYIADRGYGFASSLAASLGSDSHLVVRINGRNLPVWTDAGERLSISAWLRHLPPTVTSAERTVRLRTDKGCFAVRLIAGALPQAAADRARQRARTNAQKKGHTVSADTLLVCGFVLLVTDLPADAWSATQVLHLYRLRWQVEVLFHRWKGLLGLGTLRARDPQLAKTCLLGKLLLVLLCDALTHTVRSQMPDWFTACDRPASLWRLTDLAYQQVRQLILGPITPAHVQAHLPRLQRFLCDTPRRRPQQLATAQAWLACLSLATTNG